MNTKKNTSMKNEISRKSRRIGFSLALGMGMLMAVAPVGGAAPLEAVNDGYGGGWNAATIPNVSQSFVSLSVDRVASQYLYAVGTDGKAYTVNTLGGDWGYSPLPSVPVGRTYNAIAADNNTQYFAYAARTDGGLDAIHVSPGDGNWYTDPLVGGNTYIALASSKNTPQYVFAAKAAGGVDVIHTLDGYWAASDLGIGDQKFVSLSVDRFNDNYVYAIGADGVAYAIHDLAGYWDYSVLPSVPAGRSYTAITASATSGNFVLAARADGGVDAIHVWPGDGNWYTDTLIGTGNYTALASDAIIENYIYAASVNPTTPVLPTLSIQLVGDQVRLAWPTTAPGYTLESTTSLPGGWTPCTASVSINGAEYEAFDTRVARQQFYRLAK